MRTVTAPETTILQGAHYATFARVLVEDADGTYQDLTDQDSLDWVHSGRIAQTIDQIVATGVFTFWRKQEDGNSLAPLDEDSTLNRDSGGAYAALIDAGRGIRCEFATVAIGSSPDSGDWKRVFDGVIDEWTVENDFVNVMARDAIGAEIADRWIETETAYGTGPGKAIEDVMQDILTAWSSLTLYTPASPSFLVTTYTQQRSSVMDAVQQLAALVGWVVQPRWDDGTSSFRLTFYDPVRAPGSTDWTWAADRYEAVPNFTLSRLDIRNALSLWYTNTSGVRSQVTAEDATSITKYDRQFMEIEEPADSPIDTATEAQDMLDNALLDLKDPIASQEIQTFCFWPIQLNDYYQFNANAVHYSVNQSFGVTGLRHEFSGGHVNTFIQTRGKPAGFVNPWLTRSIDPPPSEAIKTFHQASAPTAENVGDIWIDSDDGDRQYRWSGTAWVDVQDGDIAQAISDAAGAQSTADGRNSMFRQASAPTANATGDIWFDSDDGDHMYRWSGSAWVSVLPDIDFVDLIGNLDLDTQVTGTLATAFAEAGLINSGVTINADGTLAGAGGGQASLTSLPGSVQVGSIAANAVTSGTINALAVTTAKLDALAVTTAKIGALQVTAAKIAVGTITANEIAANTITAAEIAASTITAAELNVATLSAISANLGTVTAGTVSASVIISSTSFTATTATFDSNLRVYGTITVDGNPFLGAKISVHDDTNGTSLIVQNSATSPNGVHYDFSAQSPNNKTAFFMKLEDSSAIKAHIWSDGSFDGFDGDFAGHVAVDAALGPEAFKVKESVTTVRTARFKSNATGQPTGIHMEFSAADPNNQTAVFIQCSAQATNRSVNWSNGDWDNTNNSYSGFSDSRLKQDISDVDVLAPGGSWDDFQLMRFRKFRLKEDVITDGNNARFMLGAIAQEMQAVSPGLVAETYLPSVIEGEGDTSDTVPTLSLRYSILYMKGMVVIQELQKRCLAQDSRITALEADVALLKAA